MSRHWAILIGANQYQFRQPLLCAHEDAQSLHRFLTQAAGIAPSTCVLLSDRAPKIGDTATYPTADTLKTWLGGLSTAAIQPTDTLWIFFSGYGECWAGQDYLLPLDAAAEYDANSWIATRSLYSRLSQLPTKNILLLLDMSRSQSARAGNPLGRQTMQNAKEFGISTILSCQPEQFSHESAALSNGFFTAALLEGLREHAGQPLIKLVRFLQVRLPELSEQHQRPRQDPIIMVAPVHLEQWLSPALQTIAAPPATTLLQKASTAVQPPATVIQSPQTAIPQTAIPQPAIPQPAATQTPITPDRSPTSVPKPIVVDRSDRIVLDEVTQPAAVTPRRSSSHPRSSRAARPVSAAELNPRQALVQILVLGSLLAIVLGLTKFLWRDKPVTWGSAPTATSPAKAPTAPPTSNPIPTAPSPDSSPRLNVPQSPPADSAKILDAARALIRPTNASEVQRAIERASQIPPGDGRYDETQRQIDRWCTDILDIAKQRAQQGKFKAAIAAAQLVPANRGQHSAAAQTLIKQWQKAGR